MPAIGPPTNAIRWGVAEPSQPDEIITTRLRDALALIDVRVLDHLIVAGGTVASLAERGVL